MPNLTQTYEYSCFSWYPVAYWEIFNDCNIDSLFVLGKCDSLKTSLILLAEPLSLSVHLSKKCLVYFSRKR